MNTNEINDNTWEGERESHSLGVGTPRQQSWAADLPVVYWLVDRLVLKVTLHV